MAELPSPFHDRRIAGALILAGFLLWLSGTYLDRVAHGKLIIRSDALLLVGCGVPLDFLEVGEATWIASAPPDARGLLVATAATSRRPNWTIVPAKLEPLGDQERFTTAEQPPTATLPELLAAYGACRPGFLKIDAQGTLAAQLLLDYAAFLREHPQCHAGGVVFNPARLMPVEAALAAVRALAAVGYGEPFNRTGLPPGTGWVFGLSYDGARDGRVQAGTAVLADCTADGNTTTAAPTPAADR